MQKTNYFRTDLLRVLRSPEIYGSVAGVVFSLFFSLENNGLINDNVLDTYVFASGMSGFSVAYVFCAFPFATVFCEDLDKNYLRYALIRGKLKNYVTSKVTVIYISAVGAMVTGTLIFLLLCRMQCGWVGSDGNISGVLLAGSYSSLLQSENYLLYCLLYSLQLGFLAGVLAVFASFLSLFVTNRVMVLAVPLLTYQIALLGAGPNLFSVFIFFAYNKPCFQDWQSFLTVFSFSALPVGLLSVGVCRKIRERL